MATFPSLLNVGEPITINGVPAPPTVSPFAGQLAQSGLLPLAPVSRQDLVQSVQPVTEPAPLPARQEALLPVMSGGDNLLDFGFNSPSYAPDYSNTAEEINLGGFTGTPEEIAQQYTNASAERFSPFSIGKNVFSQPLSQTLNNVFNAQHSVPGMLLGMGIPGAGMILNGVGIANERAQLYNRAMANQGQPGYGYGTIDGNRFSTSPGIFGGRVMSGQVPNWFDVDAFDRMQSLEQGIDPSTDTSIETTDGLAGYNQMGNYVGPTGSIAAMGAMQDLEALAAKNNLSIDATRSALNMARSGEATLSNALSSAKFDPTADFDMYSSAFSDSANADAAASAAAANDLGYDTGYDDDPSGENSFY